MTTMVCFRSGGAAYCLPVDATRAVRTAAGIVALPGSRAGIAGVIPGRPPLTIVSSFGAGGGHILVIESGGSVFGLLVDSVTGLRQIAAADIHCPPTSEDGALISGTIDTEGELVLLADPVALAARL